MTSVTPHVCLVGHVLVDVTLASTRSPTKMRLGGIIHAARMLWALDCPYSLAYIAPAYLTEAIDKFANRHGAQSASRIGTVNGAPNVILIAEAKEVANQGYELLLREEANAQYDPDVLFHHVEDARATDALWFPSAKDIPALYGSIARTAARIHMDVNDPEFGIEDLALVQRQLDTLAVSTSSAFFLDRCGASAESCTSQVLPRYAKSLLLKENRGGARFWVQGKVDCLPIPAQVRRVEHSVGVGDGYDAAFVFLRQKFGDATALAYSSSLAAEYAVTTYPEDFRESAAAVLQIPPQEIRELRGVALPWEARPSLNIYLAGPDFDFVDTRYINEVDSCLRYHNFTPRRPVQENGQMGSNASRERKVKLKNADIRILDECQLMLAVLVYDDPGTLIEIGIAAERGMPIIVYDPHNRSENLMLTEIPDLVSSDIDEVIACLFELAGRVNEKNA